MDDSTLSWADLHQSVSDTASGDGGFLSSASDFVAKGVPLAVAAGFVSIYNTGVSLGNVLGADAEKIDLGANLASFDDSLANYYSQHREGVELGGILTTGIIPGIGGIKALKMLQGGVAGANAAEVTGLLKNSQSVFGFFRNKEAMFTERALDKLRSVSTEVFSSVDNDKLLAIAAGVGDQALQGAAFQTAVLLTMNQSPVLSKPDEGYFTAFARNSGEIFTSALIQGAVGGGLGALGISGKIKKAIFDRDISELPSKSVKMLGESNVDKGTGLAIDFAFLKDKMNEFDLAKKGTGEAALTDRQINNYQTTSKNQTSNMKVRLTEELIGKEGDPGPLNNKIWDLILGSENPAETANLIFTAASKISRVGAEDLVSDVPITKVMSAAGPLTERKVANLLARNKIAPEILDNPSDAKLAELRDSGLYDAWKDTEGVVHVIEGTPYAKGELAKAGINRANPTIYLKLLGDNAGQATDKIFPVVGDIGEATLSKSENLLVGGVPYQFPEGSHVYNPLKNDPLTSNANFVETLLRPIVPDIDGNISVAAGDIPLLEKLVKEGFEGQVFYGGKPIEYDLPDVLIQEKLALRQQLVNAQHPFDKIARELNTTRDFAETGRGDGLLKEDHIGPIHAKISYETARLPDDFLVRGVESLRQRVELGKDMNQKMSAAVLGRAYNMLPNIDGTFLNPTTMPSLNTFLTSASGNYGSFDAIVQQVGKVVDMLTREKTQAIYQSLQGFDKQIRQSPEALVELNLVVNKLRSTSETYTILPDTDVAKQFHVLPKALLAEAAKKDGIPLADLISQGVADKTVLEIKNQPVGDFLTAHMQIAGERASNWNKIFAAKGSAKTYDVDQLYLPPINTRKYPYVNFVKEKMDMGPGAFNEAGVVVAPTKEALQAKVNKLKTAYGDRFEIFDSGDIESYRRINGEYETTPFLGNSFVDSALRKQGLLYEFQPRLDDEVLNDINAWHWNQEKLVIKQAVELKYSQEFAEVKAVGDQYASFAKSKFGEKNLRADAKSNPYYRYISTALNESSFDPNSMFGRFNGMIEGIGQKMFSAWESARGDAFAGKIDWETANAKAASYGFTAPYDGLVNAAIKDQQVAAGIVQPKIENLRNIQGTVAKINGAVSTMTLGFDFLNSLLNVVSFPILGLSEMKNVLKNIKDPATVGQLAELTSVKVPGTELALPSPTKLLTNSIARLFGVQKKELAQYYQDIGAIRSNSQLYIDLADSSSLTKEALASPEALKSWTENLATKAKNLAEMGKTVTGYNKAEFMVRFLAADMMKQITDLAGIAAEDAPAYINSFVNRVHGNYLANQRPHLFQGAVGQALSLFQTYQFNIMQNMVRYVETGNHTTAAMVLGLQNTIFGLQGNPAFYLLNQAVGNSNREHVDIVNTTQTLLGNHPGHVNNVSNWLLYGLGANVLQTALYNRGDLTPRHATIVPTDPAEIPGIAIPIKAVTSFLQAASNIVKGGNVQSSLLDGLAHFGANRPLAGLAQLTQGYRTSTKGDLLTAYSDLDGLSVAAKLAGGEEMNRSIALDAYYRNLAYKADDRLKIDSLGEALKTTMYKGQNPTQDQVIGFMKAYTNAGGTPMGFNRFLQNSFKDANQSQMNILKAHVNSRAGSLQAKMMGADQTPDFYNKIGAGQQESQTP